MIDGDIEEIIRRKIVMRENRNIEYKLKQNEMFRLVKEIKKLCKGKNTVKIKL